MSVVRDGLCRDASFYGGILFLVFKQIFLEVIDFLENIPYNKYMLKKQKTLRRNEE